MPTVRTARSDDALDILAWRNDPLARAMSRDHSEISEADHLRWFDRSLQRDDRMFFVGEEQGQKIGVIRFDQSGDKWEVSHAMAPEARGRGLGFAMLEETLRAFPHRPIVAEIREDNRPCWYIYEKARFLMTGSDGTNRHYILR